MIHVLRTVIIFIVLVLAVPASGKKRKVPDYIKNGITNCYQPETDASQGQFRTDGVYARVTLKRSRYGYGKGLVTCDTSIHYLLFYRDGIVLDNIFPVPNDSLESPKCYFKPSSVASAFQAAYQHPEFPTYRFYYGEWGIYQLKHDTVVIQWIHVMPKGSWNDEWYGGETKWKIVDRQTIALIPGAGRMIVDRRKHPPAKKQSNEHVAYDGSPFWWWKEMFQKKKPAPVHKEVEEAATILPAKLIPFEHVPPAECWLMSEDWIRCK